MDSLAPARPRRFADSGILRSVAIQFEPAETTFRLLLLVAFAAFLIFWIHSWAGARGASRAVYHPTEGAGLATVVRILLAASIVGMGAYMVKPQWMAWAHLGLPPFLRGIGLLFSAGGLVVFISAASALGAHFSPTLEIQADHSLVTSGPYRVIRHPMYASFLALWVGYSLLSANWFIAATGISAEFLIMFVRTPREERMMMERFRQQYSDYMIRTPRFIPRW